MASLGGFMVSFLLIFSFPHFSLSWTLIPFFYKGEIEQTNKNTMTCFLKSCALTPAHGHDYISDWAGCQGSPSYYVQIACLRHQFLGTGVSAAGFPKTCISNTQPCRGNSWSNRSAQQRRDKNETARKWWKSGGKSSRTCSSSNQGDVIFHRRTD